LSDRNDTIESYGTLGPLVDASGAGPAKRVSACRTRNYTRPRGRAALEIGRFPRYTCKVSHQTPGDGRLYKVCPRSSWSEALKLGVLPLSRDDARDGYVHLSAAHQVRGTLDRHFARQPHLVLLALMPARLPEGALRWEASRGGELFPHLYGELRRELVSEVLELPLDGTARHVLPQTFAGTVRSAGF
jgi:uncharacterized protein (DUF952 family)